MFRRLIEPLCWFQPARLNEQWNLERHLKASVQKKREAERPPGIDESSECDSLVSRVSLMCLLDHIRKTKELLGSIWSFWPDKTPRESYSALPPPKNLVIGNRWVLYNINAESTVRKLSGGKTNKQSKQSKAKQSQNPSLEKLTGKCVIRRSGNTLV